MNRKYILASASPRRRELFSFITDDFTALSADIDESVFAGLPPRRLCMQTAAAKAGAVVRGENDVVVACDTIVALGKRVLGKPKNREQAVEYLTLLSRRTHAVYTGVAILWGNQRLVFAEKTLVSFIEIDPSEIERAADSREPYDKAGGYGIQGTAAAWVSGIKGCYYNVMGLPISRIKAELKAAGLI